MPLPTNLKTTMTALPPVERALALALLHTVRSQLAAVWLKADAPAARQTALQTSQTSIAAALLPDNPLPELRSPPAEEML